MEGGCDCSAIWRSQADEGIYIASESTFGRVLGAEGQNAHRGRAKRRLTSLTDLESFGAGI